jgi:asparagine synthase (glutamine-hydrolysing)
MKPISLHDGIVTLSGLLGLTHAQDDDKIEITQLPPGHFETYDLHDNGKVTFGSRQKFHSIGDVPVYKTLVTPNGTCVMDSVLLSKVLL